MIQFDLRMFFRWVGSTTNELFDGCSTNTSPLTGLTYSPKHQQCLRLGQHHQGPLGAMERTKNSLAKPPFVQLSETTYWNGIISCFEQGSNGRVTGSQLRQSIYKWRDGHASAPRSSWEHGGSQAPALASAKGTPKEARTSGFRDSDCMEVLWPCLSKKLRPLIGASVCCALGETSCWFGTWSRLSFQWAYTYRSDVQAVAGKWNSDTTWSKYLAQTPKGTG